MELKPKRALIKPGGAGRNPTVADRVGFGAMTGLQFGVNIIPHKEEWRGNYRGHEGGNAHSCWE